MSSSSTPSALRDDRERALVEDAQAEFSSAWPDANAISETFLSYETNLQERGQDPDFHFNHGMRLLELGQGFGLEEHAIEAFRRCAELQPKNASAYYHLGIAHMRAQQYEDAQKAFEQAAELEPNSPDTLMGLIFASMAQDNYGQSYAWIERLLDIARADKAGVVLDTRIFYCWYGITLILSDRPEDAESFFFLARTTAGEESSFADEANFGLTYIALWRGDHAAAQSHRTAIRNEKSSLYTVAASAVEQGQMSKELFFNALTGRPVETL